MYYTKSEVYKFAMPRELKAYTSFRNRLLDLGLEFTEKEGGGQQILTLNEAARFLVNDEGEIISLVQSGCDNLEK